MNTINKIKNFFCSRKKNENGNEIFNSKSNKSKKVIISEKDLEKEISEKLNKWQTDMYADNQFLFKIPPSRIEQKRREIKRNVYHKYGVSLNDFRY